MGAAGGHSPEEWIALIEAGHLDPMLTRLYGGAEVATEGWTDERTGAGSGRAAPDGCPAVQRRRYIRLLQEYRERYGSGPVRLYSVPGRTELGGNHTDHNHGRALAAAVQLDCIAAVGSAHAAGPAQSPAGQAGQSPAVARAQAAGDFRVYSLDFAREYRVDGADVLSGAGPRPAEQGSLTALLRGTLAWLHDHGQPAPPFQAVLQSDVQPGSGLSSSACIEILLATIAGRDSAPLAPVDAARCGQFAENEYFGKPCGLLDQLAIAAGGVVGLDFADPARPQITPLSADFGAAGLQLCIIHTESDHSAGTEAYAAIPREMRAVAARFGAEVLRDVAEHDFWQALAHLRGQLPGRALARAGHYFAENRRVDAMIAALQGRDIPGYLELVAASGHSSHQFLQNVVDDIDNQDYGLALLVLQARCAEYAVVARVHGGGFGGAVQAYVPVAAWEAVCRVAEASVGRVVPLTVRPCGPVELVPDHSPSRNCSQGGTA